MLDLQQAEDVEGAGAVVMEAKEKLCHLVEEGVVPVEVASLDADLWRDACGKICDPTCRDHLHLPTPLQLQHPEVGGCFCSGEISWKKASGKARTLDCPPA